MSDALTTADIPALAKAIGAAVAKEMGPRGGGNQPKQSKPRRQEPIPKLDKKDQATLQKALETGNLKDLLENKKFQTILMG